MTYDRKTARAHGTLTGRYLPVPPKRNPLLPLWGLACLVYWAVLDTIAVDRHPFVVYVAETEER